MPHPSLRVRPSSLYEILREHPESSGLRYKGKELRDINPEIPSSCSLTSCFLHLYLESNIQARKHALFIGEIFLGFTRDVPISIIQKFRGKASLEEVPIDEVVYHKNRLTLRGPAGRTSIYPASRTSFGQTSSWLYQVLSNNGWSDHFFSWLDLVLTERRWRDPLADPLPDAYVRMSNPIAREIHLPKKEEKFDTDPIEPPSPTNFGMYHIREAWLMGCIRAKLEGGAPPPIPQSLFLDIPAFLRQDVIRAAQQLL